MKKKPLRTGRAMTIPGGALLGAGSALLWTLITSGLLGWLIHTEKLTEDTVGYGSMLILLTASILGSSVSYRKTKRQRAISCLSAGGCYLLFLFSITAMFFGGQYTGIGVTVLLVLGGTAAAIFLGLEHAQGKGRKIRI